MLTENGWPQIPANVLDKSGIPGLKADFRIETAPGDVSTLLRAWILWYDRNVEDVEFNYQNGARDEWGWSATNSVWNSNHLSGTAVDINATRWPMGRRNMPQDLVDRVQRGLVLFEGTIFWGRVWNNPDEMHYQIAGTPASIAPLAQRIRDGYLNLLAPEKPRDPSDFPLPKGYYFGPLDGPMESVSGEWSGDSEQAKDGLGRFQAALGLPVTRKFDDATKRAGQAIQVGKGWQLDTLNGFIYEGEWNVVMKEGYRPPSVPPILAEPATTRWVDVSQFNSRIGPDYPWRTVCFRVASGAVLDTAAAENMRIAREMVAAGKLDMVMVYSFMRRADNWGTMERFLNENGGAFDELTIMCDVENGRGSQQGEVTGDMTEIANDFLERAIGYLGGDPKRVCGYQNFVADPTMWKARRRDLKMIIPNYSLPPGNGNRPEGVQFFAHQYTDKEMVRPFAKGVDVNFYAGPHSSMLDAFGIGDVVEEILENPNPPVAVEEPAAGKHRLELNSGETVRITAV